MPTITDVTFLPSFRCSVCIVTCQCSGHGTCETIDNLYMQYASTGSSDVYRGWDAGHTTGCVCDIGYTGSSCSMSE